MTETPGTAPVEAAPKRNPWEERDERGVLRAFIQTARLLLVDPAGLFSVTSPNRGLMSPLLFGVGASMVGQLWETIVLAVAGPPLSFDLREIALRPLLSEFGFESAAALDSGLLSFLGCQVVLLSLPVLLLMTILTLFIVAGLDHVVLVLVGGTRSSSSGFRGTFAVAGYASVAALGQIVPLLGDTVYILGMLVLETIGLRVVHGTDGWRALVAAVGSKVIVGVAVYWLVVSLA